MEGFQAVLGFILGVIIFLLILSKLRVLFMGYYVMIFFFFISLCLGMILAKFLSWLVIILIVLGIILYIYFKLNPSSPTQTDENSKNPEETNNPAETQETEQESVDSNTETK